MSEYGYVTMVTTEPTASTVVVADTPAGSTSLTVDYAGGFYSDGGELDWAGTSLTYTGITWGINEDDPDVFTLAAPLPADALADDVVARAVGGVVLVDFIAHVVTEDGDSFEVLVPFVDRLAWPEGIYAEPVAVEMSDDYTVIENAPGRLPMVSLESIPPEIARNDEVAAAITAVSDAVNADLAEVNASIAAGDSANAQAIDTAVDDFNAGLATKSKHTLSPNAPGTTANNAGDVWERHKAGDTTKIIGRWRGAGGTSWTVMDLDATYIPQLDIGTGTFGDLSGTRIEAQSIGTQQLVVADTTNLWPDSDFLRLDSYASNPRISLQPDNAGGGAGVRGMRVDHTSGSYTTISPIMDTLSCAQGDSFRVYAQCKGNVGVSAQVSLVVAWSMSNGSTTYSETPFPAVSPWATSIARAIVVAPVGATGARWYLQCNSSATTGLYFFARPTVNRAATGELIVDGGILARHVTADMVSGLLLSGRVIQTDPLPNRGIKISNSGLIGYNASGTPTTSIDPNTGRMAAVGGFTTGTGYGDVSIKPGNSALDPSAVEFWPSRNNIDVADGNRPSITVQTGAGGGGTTDSAMIRFLGPKITNGTTRPRIDIATQRLVGTGNQPIIADVSYHAGGQYGGVGRHYFVIDDVTKLEIGVSGLTVAPLASTGTGPLYVNSAGLLTRTSSSERYKRDIEPMTLEQARTALAVDAVTFSWRDAEAMGPQREPGFIAEQADEVGADLWVYYDTEGRPTSYRYAEMVPAHNVLLRDVFARLEALEGAH